MSDFFELCEKLGAEVTILKGRSDLDRFKIKTTKLLLTQNNAPIFNEIYTAAKALDLKKMRISKSGCILHNRQDAIHNARSWHLESSRAGASLTVIDFPKAVRLSIGTKAREEGMGGTEAFNIIRDTCYKFGIDLEAYKVDKETGFYIKHNEIVSSKQENAEEIKLVSMEEKYRMFELKNVHHIDFNSSFPAGICNEYPEFRPVFEYLYEHRKEDNNKYKMAMNAGIGYLQSEYVNYAYAKLAKAAINDNYNRILDLSNKIKYKGLRRVIGYNTDGIWYYGPEYHDENEGTALGQWKHDHHADRFRAISDGNYEYEENGEYHIVMRGTCKLDQIKPREDWTWGEVLNYSDTQKIFVWDEESGFVLENITEEFI